MDDKVQDNEYGFSIIWVDPPPPKVNSGKRGKWEAIAAHLKANPNRWALVATDVHNATAHNIQRGQYAGMEAGEFEATTRRREDSPPNRCDVYAKYVGPPEEKP